MGRLILKKTILKMYSSQSVQIDANIPPTIIEYSNYLKSEHRSEWYKWVTEAKEEWYQEINRCPFCGRTFDFDLKLKMEKLKDFRSKTDCTAYDKEQEFVSTIASFAANQDKRNEMLKINRLERAINKNDTLSLEEGFAFFKNEYHKINFFMTLDAQKMLKIIKSSGLNELESKIRDNKLSEEFVINEDGFNVTTEVNTIIDELIDEIKNINIKIRKWENNIKRKVEGNKDLINTFLELSGIPYEVDISQEGDTFFQTLFSYKGNKDIIDKQNDYLSYGEANALALLLFAIEARKKEDCLIIIDDPVSSFDKNKRQTIYNFLFNSKEKKIRLLWKKTVLLLTHDFPTIVLFARSSPFKSQGIARFAFMQLKNYELKEIEFTYSDITNSLSLYKNMAHDDTLPKITRVVAARHCIEITKETQNNIAYDILSFLIHCSKQSHKDETKYDLNSPEYNDILEELNSLLGADFNYELYLEEINNTEKMKKMYKSAKDKFNKLCIARSLIEKHKHRDIEGNITWQFMCEIYHVEQDTIFTIKNNEILDVPDYIIDICQKLIDNI